MKSKMEVGKWYRYTGELQGSKVSSSGEPVQAGWVDRMMFLFDRRPRMLLEMTGHRASQRLLFLRFEPLDEDSRFAGHPWCYRVDELGYFEEVMP